MKIRLFCIGILFILTIPLKARAVGIGAFGTGGTAASNHSFYPGEIKLVFDRLYSGGGFIVDSVCARDTLVGNRLKLGYSWHNIIDASGKNREPTLNNVFINTTVTIGLLRNKYIRLWIGPHIGFNYIFFKKVYYKIDYSIMIINSVVYSDIYPIRYSLNYSIFEFDAMAAMGLNINIGKRVTLFTDIEFGYQLNFDTNGGKVLHSFAAQANAGIMFRINDTFTGEKT